LTAHDARRLLRQPPGVGRDLRCTLRSHRQHRRADVRVTKSQVAFRRTRAFAWAWMPGMYLRGDTAPLVLSVALRRRDASPRWKEIVEPAPGRFMHHLALYSPTEIDGDVLRWLQEAWEQAE
jgi:hypothetical protein